MKKYPVRIYRAGVAFGTVIKALSWIDAEKTAAQSGAVIEDVAQDHAASM